MIEEKQYWTPRNKPAFMLTRDDTMDGDVCTSTMIEDEYGLKELPELTGHAIDIGAHIGAVTVALALDNPRLRVTAVEIVPENVELLHQNVERNGISDRVTVVHAAAGGPDELRRTCYMRHRSHPAATTAYVNKHRFIGNSFWSSAVNGAFDSEAVEMNCVCLSDLASEEVAFLKIDAEGAEWEFLRDPAVSRLARIHGEYHWDYIGQGDVSKKKVGSPERERRAATAQAELARLLGPTHTLNVWEHPTIGHFEGVLR